MDRERILEVVPHYIAMLLALFLVLTVIRVVFGEVSFWIELAIVVVLAFLYRPLVLRLGIAPSAWEEG